MIEPLSVDDVPAAKVEQVSYIHAVGRVASFSLRSGGAVPETRTTPVLLVAATDLVLNVGIPAGDPTHVELKAGEAFFFETGLIALTNLGESDARFTLVDVPQG